MTARTLVILKSGLMEEGEGDALAAAITQNGFTPLLEPILAIEPITADFSGIPDAAPLIFTSAHALRIFAAADSRRNHPVYAVGAVTADLARAKGFTQVCDGGGTVQTLTELLRNNLKMEGMGAYYLRGAEISQDLTGNLGKEGFNITDIVTYAAHSASNLSKSLLDALKNEDVNAILFHSRRGAETFIALVRAAGLAAHLTATKALCISQAVVQSVSVLPFCQCVVASRPDRDGMIMLVKNISISKQEPL